MSRDPLTIEDHFPMSMLTRGGAIKTKGQRNAVRSPSGIDLWDHPMGSPFHRLPHSQLQRGRVHRERASAEGRVGVGAFGLGSGCSVGGVVSGGWLRGSLTPPCQKKPGRGGRARAVHSTLLAGTM